MKEIKDMNLAECLEAIRNLGDTVRSIVLESESRYAQYEDYLQVSCLLADRIHDLTRWIPVSERLPTQEDKDVLAWYATKYPFATLVNWYEFPLNNNSVTHWKRITPPEGK
jgi:hypothetical protein